MRRIHGFAVRVAWLACAWLSVAAAAAGDEGNAKGKAERLEEGTREKLDALFEEWSAPDSPGCVVGVIRDGDFVYRGAFGSARVGEKTPLTSRTPFYVASMSKQFTAAAVAQLAASGRLTLDDDVRKFIPEIPKYGSPITIRHLIHHRSGIRDYCELMLLAGMDVDAHHDPQRIVDLIARQKALNFEPGTQFLYSNSGYLLLAEIVKRVSGEPLAAYARKHLFDPLGMKDTVFLDDHRKPVLGAARGHEWSGERFAPRETKFDLVGSGGVWTTLEDLLLWDRNFSTKRWGGEALVRQLETPPPLAPGQRWNASFGPYAFGLIVGELRGSRVVRHGGGSFGFKCEYLRFPDRRLSVICLANASPVDATDLAENVAALFLPDVEGKPPAEAGASVAVPLQAIRALLGPYRDPATRRVLVLTARGDALKAIALGAPPMNLHPLSETHLRSTGTATPVDLRFSEPSDGNPRFVTLSADGQTEGVLQACAFSWPARKDIQELAGDYRSDELDSTLTLGIVDDRLTWTSPKPAIPVPPFVGIGADAFISDAGVQIDFTRDSSGRVDGAWISTNRAWNVKLTRR